MQSEDALGERRGFERPREQLGVNDRVPDPGSVVADGGRSGGGRLADDDAPALAVRREEMHVRRGEQRMLALLGHAPVERDGIGQAQPPRERIEARAVRSGALAGDVNALLLRVGIVARIRKLVQHTGTTLFNVDVSGAADQRRFLARVGGFGPKAEHATALRLRLADIHPNPNVDTLPLDVWQIVRARMAEQGVTQRQMALRGTSYGGTSHHRFAPSRRVLAEYAAILDDEALRSLCEGDLFWDRVVAVESAGEEDVYDLTVPGPSCWLADGIVTHNSGQIEQDADLVAFIFREEYYDKETERAGIADIIIAKHRNGAIGEVELTFAKEYPKFLNYTSPDRYAVGNG